MLTGLTSSEQNHSDKILSICNSGWIIKMNWKPLVAHQTLQLWAHIGRNDNSHYYMDNRTLTHLTRGATQLHKCNCILKPTHPLMSPCFFFFMWRAVLVRFVKENNELAHCYQSFILRSFSLCRAERFLITWQFKSWCLQYTAKSPEPIPSLENYPYHLLQQQFNKLSLTNSQSFTVFKDAPAAARKPISIWIILSIYIYIFLISSSVQLQLIACNYFDCWKSCPVRSHSQPYVCEGSCSSRSW